MHITHAARVQNIHVASKTFESLVMQWENGDAGDQSFELRFQANGGPWRPLGKTSEIRKEVTGLLEGVLYRFKIQAESGGGWAFSNEVRTKLRPPNPLTGFKAKPTVGNYSILVSWDDSGQDSVVDQYILQFRQKGETEWQAIGLSDEQTQHNLKKLKADTAYEIRLSAQNADAASDWVALTTMTAIARPISLQIKQVDYNSLTVSSVLSAGYQQELSYRPTGQKDWQRVKGIKTSVYTIADIKANTMYELRARFTQANRQSSWSDVLRAKTSPLPEPAEVATPVAAEVTASSARIIWSPKSKEGLVEQFELQWQGEADEEWQVQKLKDGSYVLKDLQSWTIHRVRVRAINLGVEGKWSPQIEFRSLAVKPPRVTIGEIVDLSSKSFRISWQALSKQQFTDIKIEYQLNGEDQWQPATIDGEDLPDNERLVTGLQPLTSYRIRLRAINHGQQGEWSAEKIVVTPKRIKLAKPNKR